MVSNDFEDMNHQQAIALGQRLKDKGLFLATAESCTGGWIAQAVTSVAGSSHWFERGFVTYSNAAKREMLGVPGDLLERFGAVSEAVVRAMASGAIQHSQAQASIATSGVAGPDGGTADKPVGTVWFAWGLADGRVVTQCELFDGDRRAVREQSVVFALQHLLTLLQSPGQQR